MTHRIHRGYGARVVHLDDRVWLRNHLSLLFVLVILGALLPPLIPVLAVVVVVIIRRRLKARRPSYRDEVLARGRKEF